MALLHGIDYFCGIKFENMDIPKSTVKEPLGFFKWILNKNQFELYRASFFSDYTLISGFDVDYEKEIVSYRDVTNDGSMSFSEFRNVIYFKDVFSDCLNKGLNDFIQNLDSAISEITFNGNSPIQFLLNLKSILKNIEEGSKLLLNKYPFIDSVIKRLKENIEEKLPDEIVIPASNKKSQFYYKGKISALKKMKEYLEDEKQFIDSTDDFIEIFTQKTFTTKINWVKYKNALHYFIDKLSQCNMIEFDIDEKWVITAKCFTCQGEEIDNKDIKTNDKTPKQAVIKIIEEAIQML